MIGNKVVLQRGKGRKRGFNGREGEIVAASRYGGWVTVRLRDEEGGAGAVLKWRKHAWQKSALADADASLKTVRGARVRLPDLNADCIQSILAYLSLPEVIRVASTSRAWMNAALDHAEHTRETITLVPSARSQDIDRHRQFCSKLGCGGFITRVGMIKFNTPFDMADTRHYHWDVNLPLLRVCTSMKSLDAKKCMGGIPYRMAARAREEIYQSRSLHVMTSLGSLFPHITQLKVRFDCTQDSMKALLQLRCLECLVLHIVRDRYNALELERILSRTVSGLASLKAFSLRTTTFFTPLRLNIKSASLESLQMRQEKMLELVSMECPRMKTVRIKDSFSLVSSPVCSIIAERCRNIQEINLGTHAVFPSEFDLLKQCSNLRVVILRIANKRYRWIEAHDYGYQHEDAFLSIDFPRITFLRLTGSPNIESMHCPLLEIAQLSNDQYDNRSQRQSWIGWAEASREQVFAGSNRLKLVDLEWKGLLGEPCAFIWCKSFCGSKGEGIWYRPFGLYFCCISCGEKFQDDGYGVVIARCSGERQLPSGHAWKCQDLLESMKIRDDILESGIPAMDAEHKSSLKFCCVD